MNAFHGIVLKKKFFMFCYIIWQKCFTYIEFNLMLIHEIFHCMDTISLLHGHQHTLRTSTHFEPHQKCYSNHAHTSYRIRKQLCSSMHWSSPIYLVYECIGDDECMELHWLLPIRMKILFTYSCLFLILLPIPLYFIPYAVFLSLSLFSFLCLSLSLSSTVRSGYYDILHH